MKASVARHAAREVEGQLGHYCERIEVAGSVRRGVKEPKDLELVYIPHTRTGARQLSLGLRDVARQPELLANIDLVEPQVRRLVALGFWAWDEETPRKGAKYKRLVREVADPFWWENAWEESDRVVIELYRADRLNFGYIMTLRTGPAEFNKLLVTATEYGGAMPSHLRVQGGYLRVRRASAKSGDVVPVPEEEDFFRHLGLPHWDPEFRSRETLAEYIKLDALRVPVRHPDSIGARPGRG